MLVNTVQGLVYGNRKRANRRLLVLQRPDAENITMKSSDKQLSLKDESENLRLYRLEKARFDEGVLL
jgi:hypothetical protein